MRPIRSTGSEGALPERPRQARLAEQLLPPSVRTRSRPASSSSRSGAGPITSPRAPGALRSRASRRPGPASAGIYVLDHWEIRRPLLRHGRRPGRGPQPGRRAR
ncbi:MAG: hypothetical protein MZW92_10240 [Comamonadaceae bacterium]|nr:hypothetical protein [Comamonadaceae bacterium]